MKKIVLKYKEEEILLSEVNISQCIFAKKEDKLAGMIIKDCKGWVLRIGPDIGSSGHYETLEECIKSGMDYGYVFYT